MSTSDSAGIGRRFTATLIDFLVVPAVSFLVMLVSGAMEHAEAYAGNQPFIRAIALGVAGYLLVNGWLLHSRGQTLGKALTGIRIVTSAGAAGESAEKAPLWKLIGIRALFFPLLYLPLLYGFVGVFALLPFVDLAFGFRSDRRCLHDLAAGTRVVRRSPG